MATAEPPEITPLPPVAGVALPWDEVVPDPIAALGEARAAHGDTFVVDGAHDRILFLFSPAGVRSFYDLAEEEASKGVADWRMLRRKLPAELFVGRRTLPHELFGRQDVAGHLDHLEQALDDTEAELGDGADVEVFAFTRRLAHRMGLASWAGPASARGARFEALVAALDALDASDAFVRPDLMAQVTAEDQATERAALAAATALLSETLAEHDAAGPAAAPEGDLFGRIVERWDGEDPEARRTGIAHDVVLVHLGSMSNLFAALGWTVVDLVLRPDVLAAALDDPRLLERCALESTRIAQRSIMLRHVLAPVEVDTGPHHGRVAVAPGATIATLLPLTNTTAAPGLGRWDPDRWRGRRLGPHDGLPAPELVTAFGHGSHTCPAQPFSLAVITRTVARLATTYALTPGFTGASPLPAQVGGVARAAAPCPLGLGRRDP